MDLPLDPGLTWPAPRTFFGAPRCDDLSTLNADVAFLGVPYDAGTLQPFIRTGQSGGPTVARASSYNQLDYSWPPSANPEGGSLGWFDVETKRDHLVGVTMADCGDVGIVGAQIEENLDRITEVSHLIAERSFLVAVGGDHSISYPVGRGMERFSPIDVLDLPIVPGDDASRARRTGLPGSTRAARRHGPPRLRGGGLTQES